MDVDTGDNRPSNAEQGETLKRQLDSGEGGQPAKKPNVDDGRLLHLKVLVPSSVAGAIIGKGAENLAQITRDSGAKVRVSRVDDCYPGTSDRVCLITGELNAVKSALEIVSNTIREDSKVGLRRHQEVKIIVPNTIVGRVIGKGGSNFRQISEACGVSVKASPQESGGLTQERCITVTGDTEGSNKACDMLLDIIQQDPNHINYNLSYKHLSAPSLYAQGKLSSLVGQSSRPSMEVQLNVSGTTRSDNVAEVLSECGYGEQAKMEILAAFGTLSKHGLLNLGSKIPHLNGKSPFGGLSQPYWGRNDMRMSGPMQKDLLTVNNM
uniref:Rna-binding protein nova-2 isoform x1 n=1 Tax=Triatoma infestans TaxID=30076 RepID=A0A161MG94_TRIIF